MICLSFAIILYCLYGHFRQISGCPSYCFSCDGNSQHCQECMTGYYLNYYKQCSRCPERCSECSSSTQCSKCKPKYWNINCDFRCDYCDESGCEDTNGYCYKCPTGLYGVHCKQKCSLCKNNLCNRRECKEGCIKGYYEITTDITTHCYRCLSNCAYCEQHNLCLECERGFYMYSYHTGNGDLEASCYPCHQNCEACASYLVCTSCKPGKYGPNCLNNCRISYCYRCIESDSIEACITCKTGYKLYDNECFECISNDGLCLANCSDGYWGDNCDVVCPDGCSICDKSTGSCLICHRDKYGNTCRSTCSEHCTDNGTIISICNKDSGKCELGCSDDYKGVRCDIEPSTATVQSSSSIFWSSSASTSAASTQTEPATAGKSRTATSQSVQSSKDGQTEFFFIGLVSGIGVCLIIGTGIGLLYLKIIRRRNNSTKTEGSDQREYVNTVGMTVIASREIENNDEHLKQKI